jgi:hypothetical protein
MVTTTTFSLCKWTAKVQIACGESVDISSRVLRSKSFLCGTVMDVEEKVKKKNAKKYE